jgi:hypothetical protein
MGLGRPTGHPLLNPPEVPLVQGGTLCSSNVAPQRGMRNFSEKQRDPVAGSYFCFEAASAWRIKFRMKASSGNNARCRFMVWSALSYSFCWISCKLKTL